jgi:glutamyl-tRNA reductase
MPANVFVVGLSWRTAPVAVREQLAFRDEELPGALAELCAAPGIAEAMLISTCNRVEIYGVTTASAPVGAEADATAAARSFLSRSRGVAAEQVAEHIYDHVEVDAVRHVFKVAAALDSLVVGEAQILGQLKAAYGVATTAGMSGAVLGRCLERAFGVAKRVRTETGISRGAANVSSVAVELARRVFVDLSGKVIAVVGAGKMSALAVRHLREAGAGSILVTNRSPEKAEALAAEVDGEARPWEQLESILASADVVISSTGSREPVLTVPLFKKVAKARRHRHMVVIDIAVPRDADPAIGGMDGVYLFDIDDLRKVVDSNLQARNQEAEQALRIVEHEVAAFDQWLHSQRVVPTIRSLRDHFTAVAEAEIQRTLKQLASKEHSAEQRDDAVRRLGQLIVNKLLHTPLTALKETEPSEVDSLVRAANQLFGLDQPPPAPAREAAGREAPVPQRPAVEATAKRGAK